MCNWTYFNNNRKEKHLKIVCTVLTRNKDKIQFKGEC